MADKLLVIDQGNTMTKLVLFEGDRIVARYRLETPAADDVLGIVEDSGADAGIYCSVAQMDAKLVESLRHLLDDSFMVLTHNTPIPIRVSYTPPEAIGLDRIAAMAGAWRPDIKESCLIVDAGTAITADVILPDGSFAGGSISPGIHMRLNALHHFTARLPKIVACDEPSPELGKSTAESMLSGCVWGTAMELSSRYREVKQRFGEAELIVTGGDASLLVDRLKGVSADLRPQINPDLVAIGLRRIYAYNRELPKN